MPLTQGATVKFLSKYFFTGLIAILPVLLTFYLLYWFAFSAESILGGAIKWLLPVQWYWPGMGLVVGIGLIVMMGMLMHLYLFQWLFQQTEKVLYRVPLIKSVYGAIRDFFNYFSPDKKQEFQQVVAVTMGDMQAELIGFVTREDFSDFEGDWPGEGKILVYLPMSYMIGGYAVLLPRESVRPVDMKMEEAMRFIITAGVTGNGNGVSPKPLI